MASHTGASSSAFDYRLLIPWLAVILCVISLCSEARPLPAQSKAPSMEINHRPHDEHEHHQQINGPVHQRLHIDLQPSDVPGKKVFKPVFTMLPKGPVTPSGPSPIINSSPDSESTQISTTSVPDQP